MTVHDPLIAAITPDSPWYVVLRPFSADRMFVRGEVIDAGSWKTTNTLIEHRYIAPLPHGAALPEPDADGVRLIDLDDQQAALVPEKKRPVPARKTAKATA